MRKLIVVKVPLDSDHYFINNVGCLRYSHDSGRQSSVIEPAQIGEYLELVLHKIIGVSILAASNEKVVVIGTIE